MQSLSSRFYVTFLTGLLFSCGISAQESATDSPDFDPTEVLAYQGGVTLSQQEIDAAFSKLPEGSRLVFIRDGAKVDQLIRSLLRYKVIAHQAITAGYDQAPLIAARLELERQKLLAEIWLQKVLADAPPADYEALAYEHYLANPDAYRTEEILDISHILLGTENRGGTEARELAASLLAELQTDPSRFDELAMEYSDDPVKENNGGRYTNMRRGMMVKPFEDAAFELEQAGQVSEPVKTEYGYHLIRLNGRSGNELQDYSTVKEEAEAQAERRYRAFYRENYLRKIASDPVVFPEGSVEVMAKRHFGENFELAPEYPK